MAEKRKRGQNFTADEKDKLVKLLMTHKDTILNKKTDGTTNQAKNEAWIALTNSFNASGFNYRTKDSLMKLWEKLKTEAKLYGTSIKKHNSGTGGGPSIIKTDPILLQICEIMGRGCTGIDSVDDCDADVMNFEVETEQQVVLFEDIPEQQPLLVTKTIESDILQTNQEQIAECAKESKTITSSPCPNSDVNNVSQTPWPKRRRPQITTNTERSEVMTSLCSSYENVNKKKMCTEDLKRMLLEEELEFKRKLYAYQLQAAATEAEIKMEILKQVKGGGLSINNLFGVPKKD